MNDPEVVTCWVPWPQSLCLGPVWTGDDVKQMGDDLAAYLEKQVEQG